MKAAHRAAALTRQLLIFSCKQMPQLEILDLNKIVTTMSDMFERLIGEDIELLISLGSGIGNIKADPSQVEQVVMNLSLNARDAMPKGGKLRIETSAFRVGEAEAGISQLQPGDYVLLRVEDNGEGMTDDVKARIFEPFFTTKQPGKGTGLGLATVYGIVHQLRGSIEVDSIAGTGTTFRIYIPVMQQCAASQIIQTVEQPTGGREIVLVVEDEASLRELMSQALREQGYTVLVAGEGTEALRVSQEYPHEIDLLITDVIMPGMRGWELAKKLTELRPRLRVLYISGYTDHAVRDPAFLGDKDAFLQKPFTLTTLAQKVRSFLGTAMRTATG
jgi:CheY-like chemotaxis protein